MPAKIQFIREWRKHCNLTQDELAERVGVSRSLLSKNETGARVIHIKTLEKMAQVFGCMPYEILARDPIQSEDIWAVWSSLNPHEQRQGIQMLRALRIR